MLPAAALPDFSNHTGDDPPHRDVESEVDPGEERPADDLTVELPDGQRVVAPSSQLAAVISAAVAGTPIPEAFSAQGITIPAPGSPVMAPLDPAMLGPGDIGVLSDRHALALGDGKALLDNQIQTVDSLGGQGAIGWQHPPEPLIISPPVQTAQG